MRYFLFLLLFFPALMGLANLDTEIAAGEDSYITITFTERNGDPVDISQDDFYYKALSTWSTDTLTVLPAAVTKSNSGQGVYDTVTFKLTASISDVEAGFYSQSFGRKLANGDKELVARGTLSVLDGAEEFDW